MSPAALFKRWIGPSILVLLAIKVPWMLFKFRYLTQSQQLDSDFPTYYFYNEVTGEVQWQDPGDIAFEDEFGVRWWTAQSKVTPGAQSNTTQAAAGATRATPGAAEGTADGTAAGESKRTDEDPFMYRYMWVEQFSEELRRPFFYNQETRESTWERPPDLAWRRIRASED